MSNIKDLIAEMLRVSLKKFVGEPSPIEKVRESVKQVLSALPNVSPDFEVKTEIDPNDPTVVRISFPANPVMLERMALGAYATGMTHEEVTAWLDKVTLGRFREVLVELEVIDDDGNSFTMWRLMPPHLVVSE